MLSLSSKCRGQPWKLQDPKSQRDGWAGELGVSRAQMASESGAGVSSKVESQNPENVPVSVLQ